MINPEIRSPCLTTIEGTAVSRLGLATAYLQEAGCLALAIASRSGKPIDSGINTLFFYDLPQGDRLAELQDSLRGRRNSLFVATGSESRQPDRLEQYFDAVREVLDTAVIDAFFLEYVTPNEDPDSLQAAFLQLQDWKANGKLRYVGASTHNRSMALRLIQAGAIDVLMLRYNMAHRKIETDVLPAAWEAKLPIVAFTCTRWGTLLKGDPDWRGSIPAAADCYRYALSHAAVEIALTGCATRQQLTQNLTVLKSPLLTPAELDEWRAYGDRIYGSGQDAFDTQWV